jgi:hypothetical protein
MCFYNSAEKAYREKNECFSPLKSLIGRQYSFQKLTQFSLGKKVLNAPASILHGFFSGDTCVSSPQLNNPVWNKTCVSTP